MCFFQPPVSSRKFLMSLHLVENDTNSQIKNKDLRVTCFFNELFISLAVLGLCCCTGLSLWLWEWGLLFTAVQASHRDGFSWCRARVLGLGFCSCSTWGPEHRLGACRAWA